MPNDPGQLGRLVLAIQAIKTDRITSVVTRGSYHTAPKAPAGCSRVCGTLRKVVYMVAGETVTSVQKAAQSYDVPRSTLQRRINDFKERVQAHRRERELTETEEDTLLQWILTMDQRGASLRPTTVRNMADLLLANRDTSKPSLTVGIN